MHDPLTGLTESQSTFATDTASRVVGIGPAESGKSSALWARLMVDVACGRDVLVVVPTTDAISDASAFLRASAPARHELRSEVTDTSRYYRVDAGSVTITSEVDRPGNSVSLPVPSEGPDLTGIDHVGIDAVGTHADDGGDKLVRTFSRLDTDISLVGTPAESGAIHSAVLGDGWSLHQFDQRVTRDLPVNE